MVNEGYLAFARSLEEATERETRSQIVFAVSRANFCWVSKEREMIQLFPPLGNATNPTRMARRDGEFLECVNLRTGQIDAQYHDPQQFLAPVWSYLGFKPTDCPQDYGCGLIKQAYEQARTSGAWKKGNRKSQVTSDIKGPPLEEAPLEVVSKQVMLKLEAILERLEPRSQRKLYQWIADLQRKGTIPQPVADMMHTIRKIRNSVSHTDYSFSQHDKDVLQSAWLSIEEWWSKKDDR